MEHSYCFDDLRNLFEGIWSKSFSPDRLNSDEYKNSLLLTEQIVEILKPTIEKFLKLCRGEIYVPLLSKGLSFPARFLKNDSLDFLSQGCFVSAKFGQMRAFLKLQIMCNNLKLGGMHESREKVRNFA